ncbi:hypothetical protein EG346_17015 [Chryseobacterium carnipullorum]|uniref:Uncharacterized protein n=1 Tax=Chryseobacterium carnipullorum TaxID=1124835 RepID=A0A376DU71_CHRCU|nr:hypothetical protein [Chryseobacterium carnipullorum]AZA49775.1 hypothetical protein EG346_17015 [Chryseobacterium carnipullorum]AZA64667.1 hypothetical protein EG345_08045 [Chryseobacterium carnipullorum]STC95686.1 Uncharacterised protein [Chryseobacterium carnipullorum]
MKKFKKRININNATSFKLDYRDGNGEMKEKEFTSYKSMEQFHGRQDAFLYLDYHRYAFVNEKWHRFMKLRSPFVFQEELDFINKTFNEDVEDKIPQLSEFEDNKPQ